AGGLARPGPGPRYADAQSSTEIGTAFDAALAPLVYCRLRAAASVPDPDDVEMGLPGVALMRDPARRDGWDWTDVATREVEAFGPAGAAVAAARAFPALTTIRPTERCAEADVARSGRWPTHRLQIVHTRDGAVRRRAGAHPSSAASPVDHLTPHATC